LDGWVDCNLKGPLQMILSDGLSRNPGLSIASELSVDH